MVGTYAVKVYRLSRLGRVVSFSSIVGHVEFETGLSTEKRSQLVNFGMMGYICL